MKNIYLETYGCQMNEYDSELIRSILAKNQYQIVNSQEDAQVVLLNTCAIRENAHQKIFHRLDELKGMKRRGEVEAVGVLGCMAQSLRKDLADRSPIVDIVAGPDSYKKLPNLLKAVFESASKGYDFSLSEFETYADITPKRIAGVNAWLAIMRGCDNFCTFCVVPYTRGRERSRTVESVLNEAHRIESEGFKQVTILGQNVNSYKSDGNDFADLMQTLATETSIPRIRFTSPHPKDFPRRLLHVIADNPSLCKQIHLPLQAGNDDVLQRMNRTYTKKEFYTLVDEIRKIIPDVALTTDVIVGFSGETEAQFEDTFEVMQNVRFDSAFIFKYSERKNTIASRKIPDDVPEHAKTERIVRLNELQRRISNEINQTEIGKKATVLIESQSKKDANQWLGRTDQNKGVVFSAEAKKPGDFVDVEIIRATTNTLIGEMIPQKKRSLNLLSL
ncbi:MAG: tRNA (N6-isopentenyl adenosine(37)-C2)-methylthiotransferase MiaB [Deferribacteres bacterium]|nr:tRNA (N6-isopentenyl adenosine(37)-C2)-methylthiotransferase MiaB [candidate division KSB1 bacterium]MCB9502299.1 tRNA (N6-isopentenyl adenosine(37)-C2)-methylthiotransferase MiaB [Deferribacteres bacterium]